MDGVAGLLVSTGDAVELVGRLEGDGGGRDTRSPGNHDVHRMDRGLERLGEICLEKHGNRIYYGIHA